MDMVHKVHACLLDTEQLPPTLSTQYRPAAGAPGDRLMQEPSEKAQISAVVCAHVVSGARHTPCMAQKHYRGCAQQRCLVPPTVMQ